MFKDGYRSCRSFFLLMLLVGCGGESTDTISSSSSAAGESIAGITGSSSKLGGRTLAMTTTSIAVGNEASLSYSTGLTLAQASRFLSQASMGPSLYDIDQLATKGYENWLAEQFAIKQVLHREHVNAALASLPAGSLGGEDQFYESFWKQAARGNDQLRQRVAFALSQIFVVSFQDESLSTNGRSVASFYDVLGKHSFGNFRNLLQDVATHPAMAIYLTFLRNKKESETRVPDENFARELMQLMTIGLYQLNQDGTDKLVNSKPVETYTHEDVAGLAKVFTGWSWSGPDKSDERFYGSVAHPNRDWKPLQNYPNFHSTSTKQVLGSDLPVGTAEQELDIALDRLFNHPNVGPFIGRQLIQRLVTSNPSPAYVGRVAAAFNDNGAGVRGDMKAVIRAILLDREARQISTSPNAGRLREPVLRLSHWMRAFYASSKSGDFRMWHMDDPLEGFAQTPLRAASVFNFYRPEYVPPQTGLANAGLVSPEMQITTESSVVGYLNMLQTIVQVGVGKNRDIVPRYDRELELVSRPDALVERLNITMLHGGMSEALRQQLLEAINSINLLPATADPTAAEFQRMHRLYVAVFLTMASPEYLVQK